MHLLSFADAARYYMMPFAVWFVALCAFLSQATSDADSRKSTFQIWTVRISGVIALWAFVFGVLLVQRAYELYWRSFEKDHTMLSAQGYAADLVDRGLGSGPVALVSPDGEGVAATLNIAYHLNQQMLGVEVDFQNVEFLEQHNVAVILSQSDLSADLPPGYRTDELMPQPGAKRIFAIYPERD